MYIAVLLLDDAEITKTLLAGTRGIVTTWSGLESACRRNVDGRMSLSSDILYEQLYCLLIAIHSWPRAMLLAFTEPSGVQPCSGLTLYLAPCLDLIWSPAGAETLVTLSDYA